MKPTHLQDALADRIEWAPLVKGGTNFRTRRLAPIGSHRLEYRALRSSVMLSTLFITIGVAAVSAPVLSAYFFGVVPEGWMSIPLLGGGVFVAIGTVFLRKDVQRIALDKVRGEFRRGRTRIRLSDIHAIQVVGELLGSGGMYTAANFESYEINLVLSNGSRANVVDHGDQLEHVRDDASQLARFLSVPVWDGTLRGATNGSES